jgi:hypothetical protein
MVDTLIGGGGLSHLWLYLVGPLLGGVIAAGVFRMQGAADA